MGIQLFLLCLHHIGQCIAVDPLHDIVGLPTSHLHDVGIWHAQGVRDRNVVVPKIMKAKLRLASAGTDSTAKAVGNLFRMQRDDTAVGRDDDLRHDLGRQDDSAIAFVGLGRWLDYPEIIFIQYHGLGDADAVARKV